MIQTEEQKERLFKMTFGEKLKAIRKEKGYSQEEITVTPDDERAWFKKHPQWSKSNRYAELEVWIFI